MPLIDNDAAASSDRRGSVEYDTRRNQLLDQAYTISYQALAKLAQSASEDADMYAECLDLRLQLHWGRIANWHVWTKGQSERDGIRLANEEVGATPTERAARALSGKLDSSNGEAEEKAASDRHSDLADQFLSEHPAH
jgi:hypothetical protein